MGTRLCFYSLDKQDDRWAFDILEPVGDARFREIIQEINLALYG